MYNLFADYNKIALIDYDNSIFNIKNSKLMNEV